MTMRALLIAAGTGKDSKNLQQVGVHLRRSIYSGDAMVFKTVVISCPTFPPSAFVGFLPITSPPKGRTSTDFYECLAEAETFICIAHNGALDGPILTDEFSSFRELQPWHTNSTGTTLWLGGELFWKNVGWAPNTQKILLLGCESGNHYAKCVNDVARIPVFGFKNSCAAADNATMEKHVRSIETTGKSFGMVRVPA
jgi:hypothetical protein